jgi:hypothetical protein
LEKKEVWVQHTILGRRGGEGGGHLAEKKVRPLVFNFDPATPLKPAPVTAIKCY